ncbi:hemagglutinin repeat-containing protein [Paludibacterium purpuratum]|uniref:Filamentous hemagglutinin family protein n=1 Tax=Paludibacterium purpuratum TaxID=1144873 RepID=A0A4R7B552_9NEIS|nr:hemagglutinin repeat-containing protein [Paludibacterium purpuratum]TDR79784.1 filamentous hemagglutinin family protein [Paludibacterium purpuratum]
MNRHLYRIVFNRVRGQLMAVAETVNAHGKAGERGPGSAPATGFALRPLCFAAMLALGSAALADGIVAAPGGPSIGQAANGVTLVQIAAPNGAGVSHNQYQQFNVDQHGAILNNSTAFVGTSTQLSGYITGNTNLKNGSARVILNEVTQANPSQLKGFVEVAGQRADVVIANPWGITCSGCGFINTARATLTTGTPQFNAQGGVASYKVNDGSVTVDSLNATDADSFAILTRALKLNGDLHAKDLQVRLGRNSIDADTLTVTPLTDAAPTPAPALALDVAALGGMYANAIHLIGTEKGVGVNSAGTWSASAGNLQLTSAGDIVISGKKFSANGMLSVDGAGALLMQSNATSASDLTLSAPRINNQGTLQAGVDDDGKPTAGGRLQLTAKESLTSHVTLRSQSGISVNGGSVDLSQSTISTAGSVSLSANGLINTAHATLDAVQTLDVSTSGQLANQGGTLRAGQLNFEQLGSLNNDGGNISQSGAQTGKITLTGDLSNRGGSLLSKGASLNVQAATLDNGQSGTLSGDADLTLDIGQIHNQNGKLLAGDSGLLKLKQGLLDQDANGTIQAGHFDFSLVSLANSGTLKTLDNQQSQLTIAGQFNNQGSVDSSGALKVQAATLNNQGGTLHGETGLTLSQLQQLTNQNGQITAGDLSVLTIDSGTLSNGNGLLQGQQLTLSSDVLTNAKGGRIAETGTGGKLTIRKQLVNAGSISLQSAQALSGIDLDNRGGTFKNTQSTTLSHLGQLQNDGGSLQATGDAALSIDVATLTNGSGTLQGSNLAITASTLQNNGLIQGNTLRVGAGAFSNQANGRLIEAEQSGQSSFTVKTQLTNAGTIHFKQAMTLTGIDLDNRGGHLESEQALSLGQLGRLQNDSGHILAGIHAGLSIDGTTLENGSGTLQAGQLTVAMQTLSNQGTFTALDGTAKSKVSASTFGNHGTIGSQGDLTLSADTLDNAQGTISSQNDLALTLQQQAQGGTVTAGRDLTLTFAGAQGTLVSGTYKANRDVQLTGQALSNAGNVQALRNLQVTAGSLSNSGSLDAPSGLLQTTLGQQLINQSSGGLSGQSLVLAAPAITNYGLVTGQQVRLNGQRLDNLGQGAWIGSNNLLTLALSSQLENQNGAVLSSQGGMVIGDAAAPMQLVHNQMSTIAMEGNGEIHALQIVNESNPVVVTHETTTSSVAAYIIPAHEAESCSGSGDGRSCGIVQVPAGQIQIGGTPPTYRVMSCHNDHGGGRSCSGPWWAQASVAYYINTSTTVDNASGAATPAYLSSGGNLLLDSPLVVDRYSSITAGGKLTPLPHGSLELDGQKLYRTTLSVNSVNGNVLQNTQEQIGSVDAVYLSNSPMSLNLKTIQIGSVDPTQIALPNADPTVGHAEAQSGSEGDGKAQPGARPGKVSNPVSRTLPPLPPSYQVPDGGLYHRHDEPSARYLVETDPRFTRYSNFISSDYLLSQLHFDSAALEKRLGDGYYEQQLVGQAIARQTGNRYLQGFNDSNQQYRALLDNAAQQAQALQLTPGVALSADQAKKLSKDMVWLVNETVAGQQVLVPQAYLAAGDNSSDRSQGAYLAAPSVTLLADGNLISTGTIHSDGDLIAQAQNVVMQRGAVDVGGDTQLQASKDMRLDAVHMSAQGDTALTAGNNLSIAGVQTQIQAGGTAVGGDIVLSANASVERTEISSLNTGGQLTLLAGNNLNMIAVQGKAGAGIDASAGHDLTLASTIDHTQETHSSLESRWFGSSEQQSSETLSQSTLQAGGDIQLRASHDMNLVAAKVGSQSGQIGVQAGNDLRLTSLATNTHSEVHGSNGYWFSPGQTLLGDTSSSSSTVTGSSLDAAKGLSVSAGHDLSGQAASLNTTQGNATLLAGNDLSLSAGIDSQDYLHHFDPGSKSEGNYYNHQQLKRSSVNAGGDVQLQAGHDASLAAAALQAGSGQATLLASNDVKLSAVATRNASGWWDMGGSRGDQSDVTQNGVQVTSGTGLTVAAGQDLAAQAADLSAQKGLAQLSAGRDLTLDTATNVHDDYTKTVTSHGGFFGGGSSTDISAHHNTAQVGSTVSADSISLQSGRDLTIQAGQVAGTNDVGLQALRDLTIAAGTNTGQSYHYHHEESHGFGGSLNPAKIYSASESTDILRNSTLTQSDNRSLIGSLTGNVSIQAGQNLTLQGSALNAAKGNLQVGGQSVAVLQGVDVAQSDHFHEEKQTKVGLFDTNTPKQSFDNFRDVLHNQHGLDMVVNLGAEAAASGASVQTTDLEFRQHDQGNVSHSESRTGVVSALQAGGNLKMVASGDAAKPGSGTLTVQGGQILAGGQADLFASGDLNLQATTNQQQANSQSWDHSLRDTSHTPLPGDWIRAMTGNPNHGDGTLMPYNQSRNEGQTVNNDQQLIGTQIGASALNAVSLHGDVNLQGASVKTTGNINLAASEGSIHLSDGVQSFLNSQNQQGMAIGTVATGNQSATVGVSHQNSASLDNGSMQNALRTQLTSAQGNIDLNAAKAVTVAGSDIRAAQDLTVSGQSIVIAPGENLTHHEESQDSRAVGVTAEASSPLADEIKGAVQAADTVVQSAKTAQHSQDARTRALAGATAVLGAFNAYDLYSGYLKGGAGSTGVTYVQGSVTFGVDSSDSQLTANSRTHDGSTLAAGHDLTLNAHGAGADSNLAVIGSELSAGHNATLSADNRIDLSSSQDRSTLDANNSSSGWGLGVGASYGSNGYALGLKVKFAHASGAQNGETVTNHDTTVNAGQTLALHAGGDTALKGAHAQAQQVVADIGGNLTLQSQQDSHQFHSNSSSAGVDLTIGFGVAGGDDEKYSASAANLNNNYLSVQKQTAIEAGDGGFQIKVAGNTDLQGAKIASSQAAIDNGLNTLTTGSLTHSDIKNHAIYSGSSMSVGGSSSPKQGDQSTSEEASAGASTGAGGGESTGSGDTESTPSSTQVGVKFGMPAYARAYHEDDSTTKAMISGGQITVADPASQQAVASLERSAISGKDQSNALQDKFDKAQVEGQMQAMMGLQQQVGTFMANRGQEADEKKKAAQSYLDQHPGADSKEHPDPQYVALHQAQLDAEDWAPGGKYSQIATALMVGLSGNVAAGSSELARNTATALAQAGAAQWVKGIADSLERDPDTGKVKPTATGETVRGALHALAACAGASASASGQSCGAAAVGMAATVLANNVIGGDPDHMTAEQKQQHEALVTSLIAGIGMLAGADGGSVVTAVNAARTELENNAFDNFGVPVRGDKATQEIVRKAEQDAGGHALIGAAFGLSAIAAPEALIAARACISNPVCLNEVAIAIGDLAAGDALPVGLTGGAVAKSAEAYLASVKSGNWKVAQEELASLQQALTSYVSIEVKVGRGGIKVLQGATPDANELRAGKGLAELGFHVQHLPTAASQGVKDVRTADTFVKDLGYVDVYTPRPDTTPSKIITAIEKKSKQADGVLVQADLSSSDMVSIANRMWGKPNAQGIKVIIFQDSNGNISQFKRH